MITEFSPEGNRNHAACVETMERMTRQELTPGKRDDDGLSTDHGRFKHTPRTETSVLHSEHAQPVLERDDEAAARLREWQND